MSLQTDIIIVAALQADEKLIGRLPAGNVHNTSITLPDVDLDNAPLPYIIVSFDGMSESEESKDCMYEAGEDNVQVGVEIAATSRKELAELAIQSRKAVSEFLNRIDDSSELYSFVPSSVSASAGPVMYDWIKPCFWQILTFNCITNSD